MSLQRNLKGPDIMPTKYPHIANFIKISPCVQAVEHCTDDRS